MDAIRSHYSVACVIPARLNSERFPHKILASVGGKPILQHIWEKGQQIAHFDSILFAIDSPTTAALIETFGGKYCMTSPDCATGTDRIIEVMKNKYADADIWVGWQADRPFITASIVDSLLQSCDHDIKTGSSDLWTLKRPITSPVELESPNAVKVVSDQCSRALYFSRTIIPSMHSYEKGLENNIFFKHIGLYAYTKRALQKIATMKQTALEKAENLEQLRFLEYGLTIKVHETDALDLSIDIPDDLLYVEHYFKKSEVAPNRRALFKRERCSS